MRSFLALNLKASRPLHTFTVQEVAVQSPYNDSYWWSWLQHPPPLIFSSKLLWANFFF